MLLLAGAACVQQICWVERKHCPRGSVSFEIARVDFVEGVHLMPPPVITNANWCTNVNWFLVAEPSPQAVCKRCARAEMSCGERMRGWASIKGARASHVTK